MWPIQKSITQSFSIPGSFLEKGLSFRLSEYEPVEILKTIAEELGIIITIVDVPVRYYIDVKLDEKLTQEKSEIVFSLVETSDTVEFSTKTFSVEELRKQWMSDVLDTIEKQ